MKMKRLYQVGPGTVNRKDSTIAARQARETVLRQELHENFGVPWGELWDKCEARLIDMLRLRQKYDVGRVVAYTASTDGYIR